MTKPTNRGQILRDWITYRVKIQCKQLDNATKNVIVSYYRCTFHKTRERSVIQMCG